MSQLLSIVKNLQFVIHFFILKLIFPDNLQQFFKGLFPFVAFDVLPTDDIYGWMFNFDNFDGKPISDQFSAVGYETTFFVLNLGSLYIFMVLQPIFSMILWYLNCSCSFCFRFMKIRPRIQKYFKSFYWNGLISFVDSSYLVLCMTAMIGEKDFRFAAEFTALERFNSVNALLALIVCSAFPVFIAFIYCCKIKSAHPCTDLTDDMTMLDLRAIFATDDIDQIKKRYSKRKHQEFMDKYGCLLEKINLPGLGKKKAILAAILP